MEAVVVDHIPAAAVLASAASTAWLERKLTDLSCSCTLRVRRFGIVTTNSPGMPCSRGYTTKTLRTLGLQTKNI